VSSNEYDEAASSSPHSCPLRLTGDHRSGEQLLADARADSVQTVRDLASRPAGRALLAQLAVYVEGLCVRLDPAGQPPACVFPPAAPRVQRPIALGPSCLVLSGVSPLLRFLAGSLAGGAVGRSMFNIGYDARRLARMAAGVPARLTSGTTRPVAAMQRVGLCAASPHLPPDPPPPARVLAGDKSGGGCCGWWEEEEAMWEEEREAGVMRVDLDPDTQGRVRLHLNSRFAEIWGRHREECQAQFAAHEGDVHHTDLGLLCSFIVELQRGLAMTKDVYQRFCFGAGPTVRAVLACTTKQKVLNSAGQLVTVSCVLGQQCLS
jgi:hypothetical protein